MRLQYVRHNNIDTARWDVALQQCPNQLIYAQAAYLNTMAVHWDAVIGGDYELLMPLPFKSKLGIRYSPVIPFIQQLGVFAVQPPTPALVQECLALAARHIRYGDFVGSYGETPRATTHANYVLSLQAPYEQLDTAYSKDLRNNLKQATKHGLTYTAVSDYESVITLFQQTYRQQLPHFTAAHYQRFTALCAHYTAQQALVCRAVYRDTELLATAIFFNDGQRLYNILSVNLPAGRHASANHFLYDRLIHEFAASPLLLDFEGSDVPGIASFYVNFGSTNQPYYGVHVNRLPWVLRLFKK